jgi:hypothetical protein
MSESKASAKAPPAEEQVDENPEEDEPQDESPEEEPPVEEKEDSGDEEPPKPPPQRAPMKKTPVKKAPPSGDEGCPFIITRGARRGQACGKPSKVGAYCKAHSNSNEALGLMPSEQAPPSRVEGPPVRPQRKAPTRTGRLKDAQRDWGDAENEVSLTPAEYEAMRESIFSDINASKAKMKGLGKPRSDRYKAPPKKEVEEEDASPPPTTPSKREPAKKEPPTKKAPEPHEEKKAPAPPKPSLFGGRRI